MKEKAHETTAETSAGRFATTEVRNCTAGLGRFAQNESRPGLWHPRLARPMFWSTCAVRSGFAKRRHRAPAGGEAARPAV